MAYSTVGDLILGDLQLPAGYNKQQYVDMASDEIDAKIGVIYETPVVLNDLDRFASLNVKNIAIRLSTGRLILAQAAGGEDSQLHALGRHYVTSALNDLQIMASDTDTLPGAVVRPEFRGAEAPSIGQQDATSPVDHFYDNFGAGLPGWQPGSA